MEIKCPHCECDVDKVFKDTLSNQQAKVCKGVVFINCSHCNKQFRVAFLGNKLNYKIDEILKG